MHTVNRWPIRDEPPREDASELLRWLARRLASAFEKVSAPAPGWASGSAVDEADDSTDYNAFDFVAVVGAALRMRPGWWADPGALSRATSLLDDRPALIDAAARCHRPEAWLADATEWLNQPACVDDPSRDRAAFALFAELDALWIVAALAGPRVTRRQRIELRRCTRLFSANRDAFVLAKEFAWQSVLAMDPDLPERSPDLALGWKLWLPVAMMLGPAAPATPGHLRRAVPPRGGERTAVGLPAPGSASSMTSPSSDFPIPPLPLERVVTALGEFDSKDASSALAPVAAATTAWWCGTSFNWCALLRTTTDGGCEIVLSGDAKRFANGIAFLGGHSARVDACCCVRFGAAAVASTQRRTGLPTLLLAGVDGSSDVGLQAVLEDAT